MIAEVVTELFGSIFKIFLGIIIALIISIGIISVFAFSFNDSNEEVKDFVSKKKVEPEVIIRTNIKNGVQTSDTTYFYHFE